MKTKYSSVLALLFVFFIQGIYAQSKTVTGTVVDSNNLPLPGVNIVIKGSGTGTQTDFDGNYSIQASGGNVMSFSYVGFETQEVVIGESNSYDIVMKQGTELEEVIVTAQGIKREKQALGYAVAEVDNEQLEQRAEGDIGRVLLGKASGVNITQQNGLSGSGTNIIIRGLSSFSGSNQPLFIVDGVPFDSGTNSQGSTDGNSRDDFVDGNTGSSRFLDLDPNNIESVNVLKGLAAATLYGTAGRNGVILITTKNGASGNAVKKNEVTVTSSLFFNEIASLPDYQDQYGNGFNQSFGWFFSNWGPSFDREGLAGWEKGIDSRPDRGFDENGTLAHPFSTADPATGIPAAFPEFQGARYDWRPYDSVEDFFRTGTVSNTAINLRGTSEDNKFSYNANYSYLEDKGFTPGNTLRRNTLGFGGRGALTNGITVSGTLNYSKTDFVTPPIAASQGNGAFGNGSSVFGELFFTPRSVDLLGLPFQNPIDGSSTYYRQDNAIQHPLWTVNNAQNAQLTNRVFGNATLQYDFNDNLNLVYRFGLDNYTESNVNQQNKGGVSGDSPTLVSGIYQTWVNTNTIFDHNFILNGDFSLSDKVGMTFNLGATTRREVFDQVGVASNGQQVFDVFRHVNFSNQDEIQFSSERNIVGLYGQADFDYGDWVYLTLAGRNDWVSNLTSENRSIFYPSISTSFIPTKAFTGLKSENLLNYLKVRAGYGTSANFPTGFPTVTTLNIDTQRFRNDDLGVDIVTNSTSPTLGNPDLKPERLNEFEVGIESRFFQNRITLNASYYNRITNDLIINRPLDPSTGAAFISENIGEIQADGLEIDFGADVLRYQDDFNWNINLNFTTNETVVTDLGANTDIIVYSGFSNLGNAAIEGRPLGVIVGSRIDRDENGDFLVNEAGNYVIEEGTFEIGDPNPDYLLNINNSITYKNFNLNFLFSYVNGGDIYSTTVATLLGRGLTTDTEDRLNTFVLPGVQADGTPNNVNIHNSAYYFNNVLFGPNELQIYDGTVLRLQELSIGYSLPKKFLDRTPFGALNVSLSGYNLWFDAFNIPDGTNFDPNVAGLGVGNGRGFDFLNGPSSRRYGMSVKLTF